ncbi:precorrin-3B C(17)-methyltransferase [Raineyella sp. CBA3103]|uniref:Precorrin-3B C(17)-methyltransferase n=1 Tax=Raineyella fluvialis TaxID=2662261 RepID=A0A5Q2FCU5_9ACTN|nr:precorrin-3B C(17)-methyltransferase [Raineyella fluvialis]
MSREVAAARIGQVTNSPATRRHADRIDQILERETLRFDGPASTGLPAAWHSCDLIVSHLALGATTRIIAPLLVDKTHDPGVVVLDEAGRFAIPVVGGHSGAANALARVLADGMGAVPVLTTATDALGLPALDMLGWPWSGDLARVTRAILDGRPVRLDRTSPWPLPPLPDNVSEDCESPRAHVVVTDLAKGPSAGAGLPEVVVHPRSLVAGMGCNRGTTEEQLAGLLATTLEEAGLAQDSIGALASVDVKASEPGLVALAARLGVPLVTYTADMLAAQSVPHPSPVVDGHVGTPSVAEASVLAHGADLVISKRRTADATCAIGRVAPRGQLSVVGLGPGARDLITPRARHAVTSASVVVGYAPYVDQVRDLLSPGTTVYASGMGTEEARSAYAIAAAREGRRVALVCSGDPALYAMASPVLEQGTEGVDVEIVPGVTASLAVSAILGAPLGHDHVTLSLSDLHTDWPTIERRLQAAAEGDFVVVLYNPRSRTRTTQLPRALEILGAHRPADTPVAAVHEACRPDQRTYLATMETFDPTWVDMNSLVVVGSSTTRYTTSGAGEKVMVTPRDYTWMRP